MLKHISKPSFACLLPAASARSVHRGTRPSIIWVWSLVLLATACSPSAAEQSLPLAEAATIDAMVGEERCVEAPLYVRAAASSERGLVCSAAKSALELLGRCDISPQRPLRVQITNEIRHPFADLIFGYLDTENERVLVRPLENVWSLAQGTPFGELPRHEFYMSIIVHEIIHAVMHQNMKQPASSEAAYEYPAYALQIESLPPDVRSRFMRSFADRGIGGEFLFNGFILQADPAFFAARAYAHFRASPDRCAYLRALLKGEAPFIYATR